MNLSHLPLFPFIPFIVPAPIYKGFSNPISHHPIIALPCLSLHYAVKTWVRWPWRVNRSSWQNQKLDEHANTDRSCSHLINASELLAKASCPSVFFSSNFELEICYETQLLKIASNSPKKSPLSRAIKYSDSWEELVKLVKVVDWVYPMPRPILPEARWARW